MAVGVGLGLSLDPGDLAALRERMRAIEGWLRDDEAAFLYAAARSGPGRGAIVEVGSWKGRSTVALAAGAKAAGREQVHAVDPHRGSREHGPAQTFPAFTQTLRQAGVDDWVVPLVMPSEAAAAQWTQPLRLLWIDGAHEYEHVWRDVDLWSPHLIEGGIIALHDTIGWFSGPRRVAAQLLRSGDYRRCGIVGITTYGQRVRAIGPTERVRNYLTLGRRAVLELAGRR
ncbi:MAG: class I SAM-dependent methyltransferase [bacterium]